MKSLFASSSQADTSFTNPASGTFRSALEDSTSNKGKPPESSAQEKGIGNELMMAKEPSPRDSPDGFRGGLFATSKECQEIRECQNSDYQASLAVDKKKRLEQEAKIQRESL